MKANASFFKAFEHRRMLKFDRVRWSVVEVQGF
jgi:hypothetical protein